VKRLIIICSILLAACTPAVTVTPQPISAPTVMAPSSAIPATAPQATPVAAKKGQTPSANADATAKPQGKQPTAAPTSSNPDFIAPEISGRPTNNSITLNVVPAKAMDIVVEYGTAAEAYDHQSAAVSAPGGSPIEIALDQLQPNTRYYYRLRYGDSTGEEHTFMTQRAPGSTFIFGIQGDAHPERVNKQFNADLYERTLRSAANDQPDFYLTIGDDFSVDQLKTVNADTVRQLYVNQRHWLGQVGAPVFLVNGNHEQASLANLNGTPDNVAVWAQTARNAYYPQPAPDAFYTGDAQPVEFIGLLRDYYAWEWGDALFVVIDPYWHSAQTVDNQFGADRTQKGQRDLWNVTLGDAQYQWFKQTLETSGAKYKFVFTHHVLGTGRGGSEVADGYEWGDAANLAAHRPGWDKTIQQLMTDNGVTIFFQGHDHIFVKQELDGVIYQSLPEPANPNYTYENDNAYLTGDKFPNSGHVRVTVSPDNVKVDYVRSYLDKPDEVAFSYTVPAKGR
jgi:phosphodiesterase/alkaline phosphatase D-like protein